MADGHWPAWFKWSYLDFSNAPLGELLEGEGGSEGNFSGLGLKAAAFWHKRPGGYPLVDCYWQNWLLCAIMMATWHLPRSDMLSLERGWRLGRVASCFCKKRPNVKLRMSEGQVVTAQGLPNVGDWRGKRERERGRGGSESAC